MLAPRWGTVAPDLLGWEVLKAYLVGIVKVIYELCLMAGWPLGWVNRPLLSPLDNNEEKWGEHAPFVDTGGYFEALVQTAID